MTRSYVIRFRGGRSRAPNVVLSVLQYTPRGSLCRRGAASHAIRILVTSRAISSAEERCTHTAEVTGSIPVSPTTRNP